MKNCAVAEFGSPVRAIASVPRVLLRPFFASFAIAGRVAFWRSSGVKPPPWIMKLSMTRWKIVPS